MSSVWSNLTYFVFASSHGFSTGLSESSLLESSLLNQNVFDCEPIFENYASIVIMC